MSEPQKIPFQSVIDDLLDQNKALTQRFLIRLSDLEGAEITQLKRAWPEIPVQRRQNLMEEVEQLSEDDTLLSFLELGRIALEDEEAAVRLPTVRMMWEYDEPDLAPIFMQMAESDSSQDVRAEAVIALGRYVYLGEIEDIPTQTLAQVENLLLRFVNSDEPKQLRRKSLEALGFSSRDEVPPLIEKAYRSGDKEWMASALFAMGRSANESWQAQVLEMLESTFPTLRTEAARAAGELEISDASERLKDLLDDPDENVRAASIWSLSQLGGEGVREILEEMYEQSEDDEELEYLESALDNLAFTEDMRLMPLFDFPEAEDDSDNEDLYELDDELFDDEEDEDEEDSGM